jgi:hypothetical protein
MSVTLTKSPVDELTIQAEHSKPAWTLWQRICFRVAFLFIGQLLLPVRAEWYQRWRNIHSLKEIFSLQMGMGVSYITLHTESGRWGIGSFASWGIALLIAIVGAAIWTWFARNSPRKEYNTLYYWLRVVVRYWAALTTMNYGYFKLFPMQMPYPSISNLHTLFGEHAPYRLYWQFVGIVTWYQVFLGVMEVTAGALLLFRRTTAIGAIFNLVVVYNIVHGNFAYDGGVHVISGEIVLFSAFLFAHYIPDLWRLLIKREDVVPHEYHPVYSRKWQYYTVNGIRILLLFLILPVYFYDSYKGFYDTNRSKEPRGPALTAAQGYYNVTEFQLNGKDIPFSPLDPVRWQDAVFENYGTFTYKVNQALPIRLENTSSTFKDAEKRYELAGFAGGRRYFSYDVDYATQTLYLEDKFVQGDPSHEGRPRQTPAPGKGKGKSKGPVKLVWHFSRPSDSRIILTGLDENKNSLYIVLDRIDEKYPIQIESPVPGEPIRYDRIFKRRYPVTDKSFDGKETWWDRPVSVPE